MKQTDQDFEIELFDEEPGSDPVAEPDSEPASEPDSEPAAEAEEAETPEVLPLNFLRFGELEYGDVKVYIRQSVYKALEKFAKADITRERGSFLIGTVCEQLGSTHVIITNAIEARFTDASASSLTFTHETWEDVSKKMEENYPDKKIVGWQHTHPSYGIFLSNYDMFIHENFFDLPFQVAYVIDPVQELRGFFQWKDGEVKKLGGYHVYDDVGKQIRIDTPKEKKQPEEEQPAVTGDAHRGWLIALSALAAALAIVCIVLFTQIGQLKRSQEELSAGLEEAKSSQAAGQSRIDELLTRIDDMESFAAAQQERIDSMQEDLDGRKDQPQFIEYTVKPGDSIYRICEENGLSFNRDKDVIKGVNGLDDNYTIHPGQVLWIPEPET